MRKRQKHLDPFLAKAGIGWDTPLATLSAKRRGELLHGSGKRFGGVLQMLEKEYATTGSETKRQRLETFRGEVVCPECGGARLRPEARSVFIGGRAIHELTALPVAAAREFFSARALGHGRSVRDRRRAELSGSAAQGRRASRPYVPNRQSVRTDRVSQSLIPHPSSLIFPEHQRPIAEPILAEIAARLDFLDRVGLGYLTLDRPAGTLSGGELQRVRLAAGLGSGLVGVCYVLDEPSIGLHPRDNGRLIDVLRPTAIPRQHRPGGRARRDDHAPRRLAGGPGAGRGAARRPRRGPRDAARGRRQSRNRSPAVISPGSSGFPCPSAAAAWPRPARSPSKA